MPSHVCRQQLVRLGTEPELPTIASAEGPYATVIYDDSREAIAAGYRTYLLCTCMHALLVCVSCMQQHTLVGLVYMPVCVHAGFQN